LKFTLIQKENVTILLKYYCWENNRPWCVATAKEPRKKYT